MEYKSYLLKIVGPNVNEYPNKHYPDNETALEAAGKMVRRYPKGTTIKLYLVADDELGKETKTLIGSVEH